jgi:hypothetical protein
MKTQGAKRAWYIGATAVEMPKIAVVDQLPLPADLSTISEGDGLHAEAFAATDAAAAPYASPAERAAAKKIRARERAAAKKVRARERADAEQALPPAPPAAAITRAEQKVRNKEIAEKRKEAADERRSDAIAIECRSIAISLESAERKAAASRGASTKVNVADARAKKIAARAKCLREQDSARAKFFRNLSRLARKRYFGNSTKLDIERDFGLVCGECKPAKVPAKVIEIDPVIAVLPTGRAAGEPLCVLLPSGGAPPLRMPPGASADAVVRRAAAVCGLAPSHLALFCGGRRLLGPAPLGQAGGVRGGGTLRVVQRLAGGAPELTHLAALTAAFRKFAGGNGRITEEGFVAALTRPGGGRATTREEAEAEFGRFEAGDDGAVSCDAIVAAWTAPAWPPHLPPAREVAVGEDAMAKWKKRGGAEMEAVLKSGAVALLDAEWVMALAARGGVLQPRQALPDEAFLSWDEVKASTAGNHDLSVVCVSHCWLQPDHPDPRGHNLRAVARALGSLTSKGTRFAVFLDFCSIHQNCRDRDGAPQDAAFAWLEKGGFADGAVGRFPAENDLFTQALGSLGTFYSHPHTIVYMLTEFPPDYFKAEYMRSGNTAKYFDRGWCFCESSWAAMVKDYDLVLDLGKDAGEAFDARECTQGRKAPVLPEEFEEQLKTKGFTNGSTDNPLVARLYREGFEARFGAATSLFYAALGWGDEEARAVARVLPHAPALTSLYLMDNSIGDEGARALAKALPAALTSLSLYSNSIGDEGARALAEALPHAALTSLRLDYNSIGDEGARALAEALPAALTRLNLYNNSIGDEAEAALRTAWGGREGLDI